MVSRTLVNSFGVLPKQNLIINAGLDFWQRSLGPVAGNALPAYIAPDRFQVECGGSSTATIERSTTVPNSAFRYSAKFTNPSGTNSFQLWQRIEAIHVKPFVGRIVTLSAWVMQTGEMDDVLLSIRRPASGVDDSWASENDTQTLVANVASFNAASWTSGVWRQISTTVLLPAGAANGLVIGVEGSSVSTVGAARYITGVMLTEGSSAPAYFYRAGSNLQQELALCQRYYEKSYDLAVDPGTANSDGAIAFVPQSGTNNGNAIGGVSFKVTKRITNPSSQIYNPSTGVANSLRFNGGNHVVNNAADGMHGFLVVNDTGGAFPAGGTSACATLHYAANAEL